MKNRTHKFKIYTKELDNLMTLDCLTKTLPLDNKLKVRPAR